MGQKTNDYYIFYIKNCFYIFTNKNNYVLVSINFRYWKFQVNNNFEFKKKSKIYKYKIKYFAIFKYLKCKFRLLNVLYSMLFLFTKIVWGRKFNLR